MNEELHLCKQLDLLFGSWSDGKELPESRPSWLEADGTYKCKMRK
eukprot:COSAG01_NODE_286_length_19421_cov_123.895663_17_plen_45_part_00